MFVRDWMTKNPKVVPSKTPVMEAMQVLREGGYPVKSNDAFCLRPQLLA